MRIRIRRTGPVHLPWTVAWMSSTMPAPAFWYYRNWDEAMTAACRLLQEHRTRTLSV